MLFVRLMNFTTVDYISATNGFKQCVYKNIHVGCRSEPFPMPKKMCSYAWNQFHQSDITM